MHEQAVEGQSYSQSFVCRLERMDVTVRQAKEASRILRKWLEEADHKYCFLNAGGKIVPLCYSKNVAIHAKGPARSVYTLNIMGMRGVCTEFPIAREVSSCFVLGVPLPCFGSS